MEFEDYKAYKYIRLATDELRFTEMRLGGKAHCDLVNPGDKVISAGCIGVYPEYLKIVGVGSISLSVRDSLPGDYWLIEQVIGKKFKKS